jgi:AcrR family transcriptional regulator
VAETRARLLDATVECLAEIGYARMTTTDVAARAGMSRGAQLYHFENKADLVATAVDHVLERLHGEFIEAMATLPPGPGLSDAAIDRLWVMFNGPTFGAWLELVMAARTDPALAPRVADVQSRLASRVAVTFFELFPVATPTAENLAGPVLLFSVLQGLALQRLVAGGPDFSESVLPVVKALAPQFLPPPARR